MSSAGFMRRRTVDHARLGGGTHRASAHIDRYFDPDHAPFERPLWCVSRDGLEEYRLPFPCIRTANNGWLNANTRARLSVAITGWKPA